MVTAWSRARKYRVAGETELSHLITVWKGRLRFQKLGSGMPQDLNPGKPRCTEPPDWPSGAPCWQPGEQHPGSSGLNYERVPVVAREQCRGVHCGVEGRGRNSFS